MSIQCSAILVSGKQCSHKHLPGKSLCGIHMKSKGKTKTKESKHSTPTEMKQTEIITLEVNGILYFIDIDRNVYSSTDVINGTNNPAIIGRYVDEAVQML